MYESLRLHHTKFHLYALVLDEETNDTLTRLQLPNLTILCLKDIEDDGLRRARSNRSDVEYFWTLTPSLPLIVFKLFNVNHVHYIDADCFFFHSIDNTLENELSSCDVLIFEHNYSPNRKSWERTSGRFNVGMVSFRNTENGRDVLHDWKRRCEDWCYARYEDGKMGDQLYLDQWPQNFPQVRISTHLGACVAPWNLDNFEVNQRNAGVFVDDWPIVFYHFHALRIFRDLTISPAEGYKISRQALKLIYRPYQESLRLAYKKIRNTKPSFSSGLRPKTRRDIFNQIRGYFV